jgi:four helix bundle protein
VAESKFETRNLKLAKPPASANGQIRDFTDLAVWRLAREVRKRVYSMVRVFPSDEKFGLAAQIRRAAVSVTANIAEGFGRYSYQENIQFCRQARGSVFEVRDHLITAKDEGYMSMAEYEQSDALAQRVIQTLNGYIRSTQARLKAGPKA